MRAHVPAHHRGNRCDPHAPRASLLQAHVVPRWGDLALADVHHEDVTTWLAELSARGLSASRVHAALVALSQMLKLAVRSGRLACNPAEYVPLPRVKRAGRRYLTHEEVDRLAEAAGRVVRSTPKTHRARAVPIPRFLVDEIAQLIAGRSADDHVFSRPDGDVLRLS